MKRKGQFSHGAGNSGSYGGMRPKIMLTPYLLTWPKG